MNGSTSIKTVDGRVDLAYGVDFVFGIAGANGRDDVVTGRLESRAANGDLVVLVDSSGTTKRVRPSKILSIFGAGDRDLLDLELPSERLATETGAEYLRRIERELGSRYPRWIETDAGQAVLASAGAEERLARKARPPKIVALVDDGPSEETLARAVALADALAPELGFDADAVAAAVVAEIPELADRPKKVGPTQVVVDGTVVATTRKIAPPIHDPLGPVPIPAPKKGARPYAERNQVWKCGTCKRRLRLPTCTGKPEGSHETVAAPAGKRRDDR